ncbi:hypothetical protein BH23CHL2_BH23CHL2_15560 [soil metagenome]
MPVGPLELGIILVIIIIIFGVGKLPQIGGALGQGIREFRETAKTPEEEEAEKNEERAAQIESNVSTKEPAKEEL